jgi:ribosomal protein L11 methyltransferase
MDAPSTVARLACDEQTARRIAAYLGEIFADDDTVCSAFEGDGGRWQVAIHFREPPDEQALRARVAIAADDAAAAALSIEPVAAADWVKESLAGLAPVRAGRFIVHGAHDRARVTSNAIGIEIEAALAFGTGHHGTTRGCLLALDDLAKRRNASSRHPEVRAKRASKGDGPGRSSFEGRLRRPPQDDGQKFAGYRGLDIGTGSGVLAIAAAKLLCTRIVASDIDRVAVAAAKANARRNRVAPKITLLHAADAKARAIAARAPYDLIFANILLGPLLRLAMPVRRLAAPGARIVLSGLLPEHGNAVLAIYRAQGLTLERRIILDGWVTLVLRRP